MAVRITASPVTPEEVAKRLGISPARERAIAELTGYRSNEAKSHARKARSKRTAYKSLKKAAKRH